MTDGHVGFSGTREGMTYNQLITVEDLLWDLNIQKVHHGDCLGADADFHRLARIQGLYVIGHPPVKDKLRAYCEFDEIRVAKNYLERDRDIVDESAWIIVTPRGFEEEKKSGTWYTARYAYSQSKSVAVVWPDGNRAAFIPK